MNEQTRKALELARESLENFWLNGQSTQSERAEASQAIAAIDAALSAHAAPVAQPDDDELNKLACAAGFSPWMVVTDNGAFGRFARAVLALRPAPAALVARPLVESVINAARAAMDESTEAYDADMSIKIPSHLAASLSLCLDEYDRAHGIGQGGAA